MLGHSISKGDSEGYVVWRHNVIKIRWRISVLLRGVWIRYHGTLFGLGIVRTRCVAAISWVY